MSMAQGRLAIKKTLGFGPSEDIKKPGQFPGKEAFENSICIQGDLFGITFKFKICNF